MNWLIAEQDFNLPTIGPGRIMVALRDGHVLSVICADRNDYIREQEPILPGDDGWEIVEVQADDGNYEVGLMTQDGDYFLGQRMDPEPEEWASHAREHHGWIYTNLTAEQIEAVVNERGLGT